MIVYNYLRADFEDGAHGIDDATVEVTREVGRWLDTQRRLRSEDWLPGNNYLDSRCQSVCTCCVKWVLRGLMPPPPHLIQASKWG